MAGLLLDGVNTSTRLFRLGLNVARLCLRLPLDAGQRRFGHFLIFARQLGQLVGNGQIQLGDGTAPEVGACLGELLELVQRIQTEEVAIDIRIGQIVTRDIGQRGQALIDMIVLWMIDDVIRDALLVAKQSLVVVIGVQIAVDHLGMITHTHLQYMQTYR